MIFEKRPGVWKSSTSSKLFRSEEEAKKFEGIEESVESTMEEPLSPLEKLRKKTCEECNCDPCECEEEWNSVEETSSMTESWMEDHS
jgi:hypothetical protein